jgi:hypothetical protein
MSYDLNFLHREPGQSWEDAIEALDEEELGVDTPLSPELTEAWGRIVAKAREILGAVEETVTDESLEFNHAPTGIQVSAFSNELTITVPYWHQGASTKTMVDVYALAEVLEQETGREGYDPQLDQPLTTQRG